MNGANKESAAKDATTLLRFVAGQAETGPTRPRVSLVLARPKEGRWHQIRRHLSYLSHPILGDSTHGHSKTNGKASENQKDDFAICGQGVFAEMLSEELGLH